MNGKFKDRIKTVRGFKSEDPAITEVSKILFKAYNTIKNWWQAFKKDGIRGLETKKIPGRPPKIKNKTLLEFMETKTKEGQYIVPEDIARDLKNELDVDYSPSGMRNALHRINSMHWNKHGIGNITPAEKAGIRIQGSDKWMTFKSGKMKQFLADNEERIDYRYRLATTNAAIHVA